MSSKQGSGIRSAWGYRRRTAVFSLSSRKQTSVPPNAGQDMLVDWWIGGTTSGVVISPADLVQSQTLDAVSLIQHHVIQPADLTQNQTIESPTVTVKPVIQPDDLVQNQTVGEVTLIQHHKIQPDDLVQNQTIDTVTFGGQPEPEIVTQPISLMIGGGGDGGTSRKGYYDEENYDSEEAEALLLWDYINSVEV